MENLYYQHAAKDNSISSPLNTTFRSVPLSDPNTNQRTDSTHSTLGVPLSKQVLEGEVPRSEIPYSPQYTRPMHVRNAALDARGLAARPQRQPNHGTSAMGRTSPIDARSLGARPQESQGNPSIRRLDLNALSPRKDTMGIEEKERYPPRQSLQVERPLRASPSMTDRYRDRPERHNGSQGDGSRADSRFQDRRGPSSGMPMRPANQDGRLERGNFSSRTGTQSDRSTRARGQQGQQGRQPRPRRRDRQAVGNSDSADSKHAEPIWNEEEQEYFQSKRKREAAQTVDYEPASVTEEAFTGIRPAVVSGDWGMSEILDERLMIAKRYLEGEFIEWHSREQKADVMTLVERLKGFDDDKKNEHKSGASQSSSSDVEDHTQSLLQKLLGGKYELSKPLEGRDIFSHVARYTDRNESYFPDDQKSLLEKVKSLMPKDDQRKSGKTSKSEVKK